VIAKTSENLTGIELPVLVDVYGRLENLILTLRKIFHLSPVDISALRML